MQPFFRRLALATFLTLLAIPAAGLAGATEPGPKSATQEPAKVQKPSAAVRLKAWSNARLAAEKQRWAEDRQKFSGCVKQLEEQLKAGRMSQRNQVRFLEACMAKK